MLQSLGARLRAAVSSSKHALSRLAASTSQTRGQGAVAFYLRRGLPENVGELLIQPHVPRSEVAVAVLELLKDDKLAQRDLQLKVKDLDTSLKDLTRRYCRLRGIWHARGILELAEESAVPLPAAQDRTLSKHVKIWTQLLELHASLEQCICSSTGWKAGSIPQRMDHLYKQLSGFIHTTINIDDEITIAEGSLNREQMHALACVAKHFSVAYSLKYIK